MLLEHLHHFINLADILALSFFDWSIVGFVLHKFGKCIIVIIVYMLDLQFVFNLFVDLDINIVLDGVIVELDLLPFEVGPWKLVDVGLFSFLHYSYSL